LPTDELPTSNRKPTIGGRAAHPVTHLGRDVAVDEDGQLMFRAGGPRRAALPPRPARLQRGLAAHVGHERWGRVYPNRRATPPNRSQR
jgi:hypothetical protein